MLFFLILVVMICSMGRRRWYWRRPMGFWVMPMMWGRPFMGPRFGPRPPMGFGPGWGYRRGMWF